MSDELLSGDQIDTMGLADWRPVGEGLQTRFRTGDFATGLRLVNRIGELAEVRNHHPDLDLRYGLVNVRLVSHDVSGRTQRDVELAREISAAAAELGVRSDPATVAVLELALDTPDLAAIQPFWAAVLGLSESRRAPDELVDPEGDLPLLWFQEAEPDAEPRQRFHLDLRVPPEQAQARIEAALAAGGVLVSDANAPAFTVLADPQGNKVCVCTHLGREA